MMPFIWRRHPLDQGDPMTLPLHDRFPGTKALAHVALAALPTPVEPLTELARQLGLRSLFVKRDDVSGEAYGGNKVRKLEFLLGQALAEKRKSVITFGARGSNHVLATAVYGRQLGLRIHAILTPQPPTSYLEANLLADRTAGATLHFVESYQEALARSNALQLELAHHDDIAPFVVPFGGTVARGTIGFVNAAFELAAQIERGEMPKPDVVYVPLGSLGTASGLALGFAALGLPIHVIGVRVVPAEIASLARARHVVEDAVSLLNESDPGFPRLRPTSVGLHVQDGFFGDGYAQPTAEAHEAVELAAAQGLHLETTYTGKTLAALIADARNNQLADKTVLFWNTYSSRPILRT
jgi:D-cysteine desulfhydrase